MLVLPKTSVANCLLNKFFQRKVSETITSEKAESLLLSVKTEHMNSHDKLIKCPLQFIRGNWGRLKNGVLSTLAIFIVFGACVCSSI